MIDISQTRIADQLTVFLFAMEEHLPVWADGGLCNAFNKMAMRAAIIGQEEQYYQRLEKLSQYDHKALMERGLLLATYRTERERLVNLALLKHKEEKNNSSTLTKEELAHIHQQAITNLHLTEEKLALLKEAEDYYTFVNSLIFAQAPGTKYAYQVDNKTVRQYEFAKLMPVLSPDAKYVIPPKQVYAFGFNFKGRGDVNAEQKQDELTTTLLKVLRVNNIAEIKSPDHVMHIKTHVTPQGIQYTLYDSNNPHRPVLSSIEEIVLKIKSGFFTSFGDSDEFMPLVINVFGEEHDEKRRPTPSELFDSLINQRKENNKRLGLPFDTAESLGLNAKGLKGNTSLFAAVAAQNNELVRKLLSYPDIEISEQLLTRAVLFDNREAVEMLTSVALGDKRLKFRPIDFLRACEAGNEELVKLILTAYKADKVDFNNIVDQENNSALQLAVSSHRHRVVELLLAAKPKLTHKNKAGMTALNIAKASKDTKMIGLLKSAVPVEPLGLHEIQQTVFGDWADVEKHLDKKRVPPEKVKAQVDAREEHIRDRFEKFYLVPGFKELIKAAKNPKLEQVLFLNEMKSAGVEKDYEPSDELVDYYLNSFEMLHRLGRNQSIPDATRSLYKKVLNVCRFYCAVVQKDDVLKNDAAYYYAYKLLVLFGNDPAKIFQNIDGYLKKFSYAAAEKPLEFAFKYDFPVCKDVTLDLNQWRKLILEHGKKVLKFFHLAPDIERVLGGRAPTSLEEVVRVTRPLRFKSDNEYPALADLFLEYELSEELFERALEINKRIKKKDHLPDISIRGKDIDPAYSKYHFVKLPITDPRAYVLGHITNCCQSLGRYSEKCVVDGLTREDAAFYVLLKEKPTQAHQDKKAEAKVPLKEGMIDYTAFDIVGQAHLWESANGNLVVDSFENLTPSQDDKVAVVMLKEFAKRVADNKDNHIDCVTIGIGRYSKTPQEFKANALPHHQIELKKDGEGQDHDSKTQALLYSSNKLSAVLAEIEKAVAVHYVADNKPADTKPLDDKSILSQADLFAWIKSACISVTAAKRILTSLTPFVINLLKLQHDKNRIRFDRLAPLLQVKVFTSKNLEVVMERGGGGYVSEDWVDYSVKVLLALDSAGVEIDDQIRKVLRFLNINALMRMAEVLPMLIAAKIPIDVALLKSDLFNGYRPDAEVSQAIANLKYYEESDWKVHQDLRLFLLQKRNFIPLEKLKKLIPCILKVKALHLASESELIDHIIWMFGFNSVTAEKEVAELIANCEFLQKSVHKQNEKLWKLLLWRYVEFKAAYEYYDSFKNFTNLSDENIFQLVTELASKSFALGREKFQAYLKIFVCLKANNISNDEFLENVTRYASHENPMEYAKELVATVRLFERSNLKVFPSVKITLCRNRPEVACFHFSIINQLAEMKLASEGIVEKVTRRIDRDASISKVVSKVCGFMRTTHARGLGQIIVAFLEDEPRFESAITSVAETIDVIGRAHVDRASVFFLKLFQILMRVTHEKNENCVALLRLRSLCLPNEANILEQIFIAPYRLQNIIREAEAVAADEKDVGFERGGTDDTCADCFDADDTARADDYDSDSDSSDTQASQSDVDDISSDQDDGLSDEIRQILFPDREADQKQVSHQGYRWDIDFLPRSASAQDQADQGDSSQLTDDEIRALAFLLEPAFNHEEDKKAEDLKNCNNVFDLEDKELFVQSPVAMRQNDAKAEDENNMLRQELDIDVWRMDKNNYVHQAVGQMAQYLARYGFMGSSSAILSRDSDQDCAWYRSCDENTPVHSPR